MNNLQLFNFEGSQVRTVLIDGTPYFVGKDVAEVLGYASPRSAVSKHVPTDFRGVAEMETPSGKQKMTVISEAGLYKLIFASHAPNAEKFTNWVASEVLPSIRKHGAYLTDEKAFDVVHNKDGLVDLLQQAADQLKAKDIQIEEMKPKALFADAVSSSTASILIGELAKIIRQNNVEYITIKENGIPKIKKMGPNNLFKWLRQNHYLIANKKRSDYNLPTQISLQLKIMEVKESTRVHADGHVSVDKTPKVTGKGQQYFINKFLKGKAA